MKYSQLKSYMDALVQERHNSSVLAVELCLSCTNSSNGVSQNLEPYKFRNKTSPISREDKVIKFLWFKLIPNMEA